MFEEVKKEAKSEKDVDDLLDKFEAEDLQIAEVKPFSKGMLKTLEQVEKQRLIEELKKENIREIETLEKIMKSRTSNKSWSSITVLQTVVT